jgi:hypothetical protein
MKMPFDDGWKRMGLAVAVGEREVMRMGQLPFPQRIDQ